MLELNTDQRGRSHLIRRCPKCEQYLSAHKFRRTSVKSHAIGDSTQWQLWCKECIRSNPAQWVVERKRQLMKFTDYVERRRRIERARRYRNSKKLKHNGKKNYLKRNYKLSITQYQAMLSEQGGRCLICRETMTRPHVDHNHITGRVRGLLCQDCNLGIGRLKENIEILLNAISYIKNDGGHYL